jgi:hypothetical protein
MQYNHSSQHSRQVLASRLTNRLTQMGFRPFYDKRAKEIIFAHPVHESPGVSVLVYTSCAPAPSGGVEARRCGKDAIRVCAIYKNRGLVREKRINRVGQVEDIVNRMHLRAREVYRTAKSPHQCPECGEPTFTSKKGNQVCVDLCWKNGG